jgi:FtsH-binding integral membrane protein
MTLETYIPTAPLLEPDPEPEPMDTTRSRAGRKSEKERLQTKAEAEALARRLTAQSKRAQPIDPHHRIVLVTYLIIAIVIFITSGLFSFATIAATAQWMKPEWPWLVWVVPGFVELFIIAFGIDAILNQARGDIRDARWALTWMLVFSGVAVIGNAAHTIDGWGGSLADWRAWVGTGFSALAPLSVVLITKRVSKLVFAKGGVA